MSKRLAFAVATAAELEVAGATILQSTSKPSPEPSTVQHSRDESKDSLTEASDDFSPADPLPDSEDESDAIDTQTGGGLPHQLEGMDSRYLSEQDIVNLQPLPSRQRASRLEMESGATAGLSVSPSSTAASSSAVRHRTSIYVDSHDSSPTEVFCSAFSPDSQWLAVGCGDGSIRVFNAAGKLRWQYSPPMLEPLPVTCLRFRPAAAAAFSSLHNVILAVSADGTCAHYHLSPASSSPSSIVPAVPGNQLFACVYSPSALHFATAGRDATIRIYDSATSALTTALLPLSAASSSSSGHSNRIYSLRFHPSPLHPSLLFSAGWDNTVLVWDTRAGRTSHTLYGPHICGDALDLRGSEGAELLTGSWRQSGCLQVWDWAAGKVREQVEYNAGSEAGGGGRAEMLYAACYSADGTMMAAGGCGSNDAKLMRLGEAAEWTAAGGGWEERISLKGGVYTTAFSPDGKKLAVAGADANMIVVDL
jgi:COMPASS component SWD3